MNPQEIMDQIKEAKNELSTLNSKLFNAGREKEYTERAYRVALAKKLLELRAQKCTTAIINDIARGDSKISELRLKRGLAENKFNVIKDVLQNKRMELDCLRSLLTWLRVELKNS